MHDLGRQLSPSLLAAQEKLRSLRQKRRAERKKIGQPVVTDDHGRFPPSPTPTNKPTKSGLAAAPHLGWESEPFTAVLRRAQTNQQQPPDWHPEKTATAVFPNPAIDKAPDPNAIIKLYPDLALGMLRREQAAVGRIWLLLKLLDSNGRGWITENDARAELTRKRSPLRVCGWRQMRNLLARGEGIFWQRRAGRIWLRSVAKVAAALQVSRLQRQPVGLRAKVLTQGMGQVRAHFYASFHSSRNQTADSPQSRRKPIARATLARLSHTHIRTQRRYEKRVSVRQQRNFALGPQATARQQEEQAWQHGRALFHLTDYRGQQGRPGVTYVAWQLPNSYVGPHAPQPRGRQKRINQELADLFMKGMTGNGERMVDTDANAYQKRFFGNGRQAAKARHSHAASRYWPRVQTQRSTNGRCQLWYALDSVR